MEDIIDISVVYTIDDVTITATPSLIEVNVNQSSGNTVNFVLRSSYSAMIADGTPNINTLYTVTADENKSYTRSTYLWKTDGKREWIASTPDN
jgi:hypothetical protein